MEKHLRFRLVRMEDMADAAALALCAAHGFDWDTRTDYEREHYLGDARVVFGSVKWMENPYGVATDPPHGWYPFGYHVQFAPNIPDLEFWGIDESGDPIWEWPKYGAYVQRDPEP